MDEYIYVCVNNIPIKSVIMAKRLDNKPKLLFIYGLVYRCNYEIVVIGLSVSRFCDGLIQAGTKMP